MSKLFTGTVVSCLYCNIQSYHLFLLPLRTKSVQCTNFFKKRFDINIFHIHSNILMVKTADCCVFCVCNTYILYEYFSPSVTNAEGWKEVPPPQKKKSSVFHLCIFTALKKCPFFRHYFY